MRLYHNPLICKLIKARALFFYKKNVLKYLKGTVLDFGCGEGDFLNMLKGLGYEAYGVDIGYSKHNIKQPKYNYPEKIYSKFDTVTAFSVLNDTPNLRQTIKEIEGYARERIIIITDTSIGGFNDLFKDFTLGHIYCINKTWVHYLLKSFNNHYKDYYLLVYYKKMAWCS
jgi:2-polyprenyl-3-methyl-5-hydroxy-6-metoxy-1,4-benzoquinol methylase